MSETKGDSQAKSFTAEEIGKHNTRDDVWIVISNKVYNVTNFLDEHPGGEEVILENAGKDATNDFDDIGHSEDAREMLKDYLIGELKGAPPTGAQGAKGSADSHLRSQQNNSSWGLLIPLAFAAALVAYKMYA